MTAIVLISLAVVLFFGVRKRRVYFVRGEFIDMDDFPESYRRLPKSEEMIWHPKHWGRWTVAQWQTYVSIPEEQAA